MNNQKTMNEKLDELIEAMNLLVQIETKKVQGDRSNGRR